MEQEKIISRFSQKETTAAKFLAELMIMRQAARNKKFLPNNFWNSPLWKVEYTSQISAAHSLLKYFDFGLIRDTLDDKKNSWISTLRYKNLINLVKEKQAVIKIEVVKEQKTIEPVKQEETLKKPAIMKKQTTRSKLEELDG